MTRQRPVIFQCNYATQAQEIAPAIESRSWNAELGQRLLHRQM
jgi:hypothetical protein